MAAKYDKNGYNSSDFKRNSTQETNEEPMEHQDGEEDKINEKAGEYVRELLSEKIKLNITKFPESCRLIDEEVAKVRTSGRVPPKDFKYLSVNPEKPIKVTVRVLVPIREYPKVNFVGKLLGPQGSKLKQLQEETMCKMAILGRGSMRDRNREESLRNSLDPKYAHLTDELHVEISSLATPTEAHARISYALAEIRRYLIPEAHDMVRQPQPREIMDRDTRTRQPLLATPGNVVYRSCSVSSRSLSYQNPVLAKGGLLPPHIEHRPPPHHAQGRMPPPYPPRRAMSTKAKVFSILEKARNAMESTYSYNDYPPEPQTHRGPARRSPEQEFYYERGQEQFYEDEEYYKDDAHEYKPSARDVGTRRAGHAPTHSRSYRASPYARGPK